MIGKIKFEDLPGFSKLFIKQISEIPTGSNLFIFPKSNNSIESIISELSGFFIDEQLIELLSKVNKPLKMSNEQRDNLKLLNSANTFFCTATFKPSFLGGSSNVILKIISVFIQSEFLKSRFKSCNFIPLIWLDDDTHDNLESSLANIYTKDGEIIRMPCCFNASKSDRTVIHQRIFNNDIPRIIDEVISLLPESDVKERTEIMLKNAYQQGRSWSFSSAYFLNSIFKYLGILFLFTSKVRKGGLFNNLTAKEISERGKTYELLKERQLHFKKYHIEIPDKSQQYNLNIHKGEIVEKCEKKESVKFTDYSPNVMLRPIFQDSLLPVVARIASPSEFVSSLLLDDIYNHFEAIKPMSVPRFSTTFVDSETKNFIEESGTDLKEIAKGYPRLQRMFPHNSKVRNAINWLYPEGNLQERLLSTANIINASKKQFIIRTVRQINGIEPTKHLMINL